MQSTALKGRIMGQTFILLKPDAIERDLVEPILDYFKQKDVIIQQQLELIAKEPIILAHYDDVIKRVGDFLAPRFIEEFNNKKVIAVLLESHHENLIEQVREWIGPTDPAKASTDTIRGKYANDSMEASKQEGRLLRNLIHASDSFEAFQREVSLWFS